MALCVSGNYRPLSFLFWCLGMIMFSWGFSESVSWLQLLEVVRKEGQWKKDRAGMARVSHLGRWGIQRKQWKITRRRTRRWQARFPGNSLTSLLPAPSFSITHPLSDCATRLPTPRATGCCSKLGAKSVLEVVLGFLFSQTPLTVYRFQSRSVVDHPQLWCGEGSHTNSGPFLVEEN